MITLHIKGSLTAAVAAAGERRIELNSIQCRYRGGIAECFAGAHDEFIQDVREWYHEDAELIDGYGYPAGVLLHFSSDASK